MIDSSYRYLVRLPMSMRNQLAEAAEYHRRSLNSEIVTRLQLSFSGLPGIAEQRALAPAMHEHFELLLNRTLSPPEQQLLRRFRGLSAAKQAALLDLLS
ncbi:MAG: Arc family DNA-binding protein [Pseudomonadales bacterium]